MKAPEKAPSPAAAQQPLSRDDRLRVERLAGRIAVVRSELRRRIVGQDEVITQLLAGILAEGHCLIIGLPGLAKTLLVSSLAELLSLDFRRIQFTPDLMPSDITGTTVIAQNPSGQRGLRFMRGPLFAHIVLADEINRTPPKTQAALMEAMEERQISVAGRRMPLPRPFFVLATQNPIEQEGTYPLPVSELDRFLFNITIDYPEQEEEYRILVQTTSTYRGDFTQVLEASEVREMLELVPRLEVSDELFEYAAAVVRRTRPAEGDASAFTREFVAWGGGPRAPQGMVLAAKAMAFMAGRPAVTREDLEAVVVPTLRHRILLRYHAEAEGVRSEDVIREVLGETASAAGR